MVVVISYKTKATAREALTFIVRIFVNDTKLTSPTKPPEDEQLDYDENGFSRLPE
jgi:hypothetical protein